LPDFRTKNAVCRLPNDLAAVLARPLLHSTTEKIYARVVEPVMPKTNGIVDFLEAALRAEGLRQKLISNNIANAQSPGYRRLDVKFEQLLAKALESEGQIDPSRLEPQVHQPNQTPVKSNGNDVELETEIGEMVKNTLRYKTYIRLINKKYDQIEQAITIR